MFNCWLNKTPGSVVLSRCRLRALSPLHSSRTTPSSCRLPQLRPWQLHLLVTYVLLHHACQQFLLTPPPTYIPYPPLPTFMRAIRVPATWTIVAVPNWCPDPYRLFSLQQPLVMQIKPTSGHVIPYPELWASQPIRVKQLSFNCP